MLWLLTRPITRSPMQKESSASPECFLADTSCACGTNRAKSNRGKSQFHRCSISMLRLINGKLNSSLRLRISATFIGLILAIGVVVLTSFTFLTTRQVERTVQKDVEATASLIRHLIAERAADLESRTTLIAQLPTIQSAILNARDKDTVADRAEYYLPKLNADGLVIADRDAQILASVGCASRSSDQQSSKPFLEKALEGTPVKGVIEFDNRMMLITAVPIRVSEFVQGALLAYS